MKKSTAIIVIALLAAAAIAGTAVGVVNGVRLSDSDRFLSDNYRHAFSELTSGVSDMDKALKKAVLVTSPALAGATCAEVYGKSQTAQMALGVLPLGGANLEKTAGFIGRAGDYAFALSRKAANGESFSEEERANLRALSQTSAALSERLKALETQLFTGEVTTEAFEAAMEAFDHTEGETIPEGQDSEQDVTEGEYPEIPSLIYDGPFSEHLENAAPRFLEGREEIDVSAGRKIAAAFLGLRSEAVYPTSEQEGDIPSFRYEAQLNGEPVSVTVSKQGGVVYEMLSSRAVQSAELTAKEALDKAAAYLQRRGFEGMKQSYYLISNNILTANYAYVQDGTVCYSDLIKVGVALDNGTVVCFEAKGYIMSHVWRELPAAAVSAQEAQSRVPEGMSVLGVESALIPTDGKYEKLCWEFECQEESGTRCIIYVSAETGQQEKILILLEDENGTLTI